MTDSYCFENDNYHLACCLHCMLENALLNTREVKTAMLLQAAIGALNRMGENARERNRAAFASYCNRRELNGGKPCEDTKELLRQLARNNPCSYLKEPDCSIRGRSCPDISVVSTYLHHCEQVKRKLTLTKKDMKSIEQVQDHEKQ